MAEGSSGPTKSIDLDLARESYERDGFVVVENLLGPAEIEALNAEAAAIARGERGAIVGTDPGLGKSETELLGEVIAIHFPHKISELVLRTMAHPNIVPVLQSLISPNVKAMQTMLFVKHAGQPGQAWHQDEHFIPTRDRSLTGAWIALDDATIENGCMWMHPGSHRPGVLWPMRPHDDPRFDVAEEVWGHPYPREGGAPVEVRAGGVAFFNGYVLHRSLPNRAKRGFRRALVTHYMSAESLLPWTLGAPRARPDVRDIVMICGEDPYAWRGLEAVTSPYVRPENAERAKAIYAELAEGRRGSSAIRSDGENGPHSDR
ncbi:MAG TPA: phytanoyl-CoA dioxygenase family protein [Caulobacteraceae bacterium]